MIDTTAPAAPPATVRPVMRARDTVLVRTAAVAASSAVLAAAAGAGGTTGTGALSWWGWGLTSTAWVLLLVTVAVTCHRRPGDIEDAQTDVIVAVPFAVTVVLVAARTGGHDGVAVAGALAALPWCSALVVTAFCGVRSLGRASLPLLVLACCASPASSVALGTGDGRSSWVSGAVVLVGALVAGLPLLLTVRRARRDAPAARLVRRPALGAGPLRTPVLITAVVAGLELAVVTR